MSISDLELILKKDPVISTWPARSLRDEPARVEQDYLVHARTHISLGDTAKYVDTIFRWVGGANKGTFVGAVLGDYGQGKTSFLVHVWAKSRARQVFVVPPFEWSTFEEIVDAVAGWADYVLTDRHPELALRVKRLHEEFQQRTIEYLAKITAQQTGRDYDETLETVRALVESGGMRLREMSAERLLGLIAKVTDIVGQAGYRGLLLLLDEPEVAAKQLGNDTVQHFIFNLANELHRGEGSYGVFLSMPANFYASAQSRFSALTARLEVCRCFPRLGDMYGPDFARDLWERYVQEFDLGPEGTQLATDSVLAAIGQIGSSEHRDLAYGPRTVVSAFRRMVEWYRDTGSPYEPLQLVQDLLDDEIMVTPEYRTRVNQALRAPEVSEENREAVKLLAAFPSGLHNDVIRKLGYEDLLRPLARGDGLVYRTAFTMGLRVLRSGNSPQRDVLRDMIEEIDSEYAPDRRAFENALKAFGSHVIPLVFAERSGQQLVGWQYVTPLEEVSAGVLFGTLVGAFEQMSLRFPCRAAMLIVNDCDCAVDDIEVPELNSEAGPQQYDLIYQFSVRWHAAQAPLTDRVQVKTGPGRPSYVRINLDWTDGTVDHPYLAELVGANRLTPLWTLNLLHRMDSVDLDREFGAQWSSLQEMLTRRLVTQFLGTSFGTALAEEIRSKFGTQLSGSGLTRLDQASTLMLDACYPDYMTLMRQPHWQSKVDDYIKLVSDTRIPLACRRGREIWRVSADEAATIFGTSRMNLTGGAFRGFESLIEISSSGRNAPLQVRFHIHPLEQHIRDLICSQPMGPGQRFKYRGKECWYLSQAKLAQAILGQGYTLTELRKIIEIGRARGSYHTDEKRGEPIVFCQPLDVEELKAQLRTKLQDLVEELREYGQIDGFVSSFDPTIMERAIENIKDDADYDKLLIRMTKEFESNHSRLPGYFDRLNESMSQVRNMLVSVQAELTDSRDVKQLQIPSSKSGWGSVLGRVIVPNLQQTAEELCQKATAILRQLDDALVKYSYSAQRTPQDNLTLLREGWSIAESFRGESETVRNEAGVLFKHLGEFSSWIALLQYSDALYERLVNLKADSSHGLKGEEYLASFDKIASNIEDYLTVRNVAGLAAHAQFQKQLEELEVQRQQYLQALRGTFNQYKDRLNSILSSFGIDGRVNVVFNPEDMHACYRQLIIDAVQLLQSQLWHRLSQDAAAQERELTYARDILRAIDSQEAKALLEELRHAREGISRLRAETDEARLRQLVETHDDAEIACIAQQIAQWNDAIRTARRKAVEVSRPALPESQQTQRLYNAIPEVGRVDLKDLVLAMMSQASDPSMALEHSLEALTELFRHNCVQVTVERRQR